MSAGRQPVHAAATNHWSVGVGGRLLPHDGTQDQLDAPRALSTLPSFTPLQVRMRHCARPSDPSTIKPVTTSLNDTHTGRQTGNGARAHIPRKFGLNNSPLSSFDARFKKKRKTITGFLFYIYKVAPKYIITKYFRYCQNFSQITYHILEIPLYPEILPLT